jgi:CubicO group peptidase (beta-lactamase class C family)
VFDTTFLQACEATAARFEVPAMVVGATSADGTTELHAVGCDLETRFRVASVTKPMTASLAFQLLDVGASTGVWSEDVTVGHLLSHTSGFDCELGDLTRFGAGDDALGAAVRELPTVRRLVPADAAWSYANTGYWLAGWLAAQAAGATYEDALREHVLRPAGMASSGFDAPDLPGTGEYASDAPYPRARRPSGGLVADATDLLRFGWWQLSEPWTRELRTPRAKPVGGVYGLGFFGERVGGVDVWGHTGSAWGFQASFLLVPDRRAVFVGVMNTSDRRALRELEDLWFEGLLGTRRRIPETVQLSPEALAAFAGTYANGETIARVAADGTHLAARMTEGRRSVDVVARPIGERTFEIVGGPQERNRFDFPLEGFARAGSRLLERVA